MGNIAHPTGEARIRPVFRRADEAVFYRVRQAILHRGDEIRLAAQGVLPEPPLPDAALAFADLAVAGAEIPGEGV